MNLLVKNLFFLEVGGPTVRRKTVSQNSFPPNGGDFSKQSCKKVRKWKKLSKLTDNISNQSLETNLRVLLELTSL